MITLKVKSDDKEMEFTLQSKRESKHTVLTLAQILPTQVFPRTSSALPTQIISLTHSMVQSLY